MTYGSEPGGPINRTDDPIGECALCDQPIGGRGLPWMRHQVPVPQGQYMTTVWKDVCLPCIEKEGNGP